MRRGGGGPPEGSWEWNDTPKRGGFARSGVMGTLTEPMMKSVREQRLGYVATVAADGSPMVSPKGSLTVWDPDHLVFADIESPHTVRNLESNPRTEVNVVDPFTRKGFRFTGTGKVLHAGSKFFEIL